MYAFTFFFANFGPNSTTFIVPAEVFPAWLRSTCHGISAATGKMGAIVGAFGFLYLAQNPDPAKADRGYPAGIGVRNALFLLAVCNLLGLACTFLVPESKGRSLEEMTSENEATVDDDHKSAYVSDASASSRNLGHKFLGIALHDHPSVDFFVIPLPRHLTVLEADANIQILMSQLGSFKHSSVRYFQGFAGIAAAHALKNAAFQVVLLESRDRIGGRVHTNYSFGFPVDMGAAWLHGVYNENPLASWIGRLGLPIYRTSGDNSVLYDHDLESYALFDGDGHQVPQDLVEKVGQVEFEGLGELRSKDEEDEGLGELRSKDEEDEGI
ncbi:hypothetical protein ZIOFF_047991 [Zingiber officinale]|uniref:Major facilitator superfamily (MFS) profile domain-containing protein n=1 Tax=Zingiber officinale TaxID=94328 RepID=A0A8J5FNY3_ZINOF|nr:hypothetical protein ZIOFF_047991 [Zingiber officinale]